MSKYHALLSPSSSERWINCPGSVKAIVDAQEKSLVRINKTSFYADEGTLAHELAEKALTGSGNCFDYEDVTLELENAVAVSREMCEYVQSYVDFVKLFDGDLRVEQRVYYTDWVPEGSGTSDAVIVQDDRLVCIDLKYGKGLVVDAKENTQALCYALGTYQGLSKEQREKIKTVLMVIHQPRLDNISEWEISITDLLRRGEYIGQAAELALTDDAPLRAGESQCRWCPINAMCPEQLRLAQETIGCDFDDLSSMSPVNLLSDAKLRLALDNKATIVAWLGAVEKMVSERLESGGTFDGYKLVEGRSLRAWADEQSASELLELTLGDDAYTKKLLSPTQAEKALGKELSKVMQGLIVKPAGKPTLVHESDKRPSVQITVADFD